MQNLGAENPELSKVSSFKPGLGQDIAFYASPAARISVFLISLSKFVQLYFPANRCKMHLKETSFQKVA